MNTTSARDPAISTETAVRRLLSELVKGYHLLPSTRGRWLVTPPVDSRPQAEIDRLRYTLPWRVVRHALVKGYLAAGAPGDASAFTITEQGHWLAREWYGEDAAMPALPLLDPPPSVPIDTSEEAAAGVEKQAGAMRYKVLSLIAANGSLTDGGMTTDAVDAATGWGLNTTRPRVWELERLGLIEKTTDRAPTRSGRGARVYRVTAAGIAALGNWRVWRLFRRAQ